MLAKSWALIKNTVSGFLAHAALSRAAAIAYFTIFSLAPLLIIVIGIASLVFGYEAAQGAIVGQFSGLMGKQSTEALQSMIQSASLQNSGTLATVIGVVTLLITASGAFSEIQSSLNVIWNAEPQAGLSRLVRARIAGLGLVLTLGFLMLASLVISAGLSALGGYLDSFFPAAHPVIEAANFVISILLLSAVFAAIFKFLPDKSIDWRDVAVGAVATAILFTIGKSLIGLYIGSSHVASGFGAAGALIVMLVWIYYSSLIFLLGAEFTRAYTEIQGSHAEQSEPAATEQTRQNEPPPGAEFPSEILAMRVDLTRGRIDETLQVIHSRIPPSPALPDDNGRRPSWLQLIVAGLAVMVLPPHRPEGRPATPRRPKIS